MNERINQIISNVSKDLNEFKKILKQILVQPNVDFEKCERILNKIYKVTDEFEQDIEEVMSEAYRARFDN